MRSKVASGSYILNQNTTKMGSQSPLRRRVTPRVWHVGHRRPPTTGCVIDQGSIFLPTGCCSQSLSQAGALRQIHSWESGEFLLQPTLPLITSSSCSPAPSPSGLDELPEPAWQSSTLPSLPFSFIRGQTCLVVQWPSQPSLAPSPH